MPLRQRRSKAPPRPPAIFSKPLARPNSLGAGSAAPCLKTVRPHLIHEGRSCQCPHQLTTFSFALQANVKGGSLECNRELARTIVNELNCGAKEADALHMLNELKMAAAEKLNKSG